MPPMHASNSNDDRDMFQRVSYARLIACAVIGAMGFLLADRWNVSEISDTNARLLNLMTRVQALEITDQSLGARVNQDFTEAVQSLAASVESLTRRQDELLRAVERIEYHPPPPGPGRDSTSPYD